MKLVVTGSLGTSSAPLTRLLVQQGHAVTVVSSQPARRGAIEALGATAAIGTLQDVAFLAATCAGADAGLHAAFFAKWQLRPHQARVLCPHG